MYLRRGKLFGIGEDLKNEGISHLANMRVMQKIFHKIAGRLFLQAIFMFL